MKNLFLIAILLASLNAVRADWLQQLGLTQKPATNAAVTTTSAPPAAATSQSILPAAGLAALPAEQAVSGLKEALGKGVQSAVSRLGRDGGFLTNLNVKIPMPEKLQTVEKSLRLIGQNKYADDFVNTMNRAAEQAVPVAAGVFGDAVKQMSIADAKSILSGPADAGTQFFRKVTQTNLFAKFLPVVKTATDKVGVTSAYKQMVGKANLAQPVGNLLGGKTQALLTQADLDNYVTDKAMDGLFKMVAEEEKRIRENPVARTSELLQTVFGAIRK